VGPSGVGIDGISEVKHPEMPKRLLVKVTGAVQGVGFRPFVCSLATRLKLDGYVSNDPEGVVVEVEGEPAALEAFLLEIRESSPPMARVEKIIDTRIQTTGIPGFMIKASRCAGKRTVLVLPDLGTCEDCLREMQDPSDRRFRYAFINCTNCGPRYTIIKDLPYDRKRTTMVSFQMCPECCQEYESPSNRRFHAEPTCCKVCGPQMRLIAPDGTEIPCADPMEETKARLARGGIVAMKGLGGFHLVCAAENMEAVKELRKRKRRDLKPFAVMVSTPQEAMRICIVSSEERELLCGPERPIVLLRKRDRHGLAEAVAPGSMFFGVMLPYTPMHALLMQRFDSVVMTSGNISDEPIAYQNEDALRRLNGLADCFLMHNRDIQVRTDDSVMQVTQGHTRFLRRSRGYAPFPVRLPLNMSAGEILAVGAEQNNTICWVRKDKAFLSHHIGDLQEVKAYESFLDAIEHIQRVLGLHAAVVACDMHPGYLTTKYARQSGLEVQFVQHHHAHIASVLAEEGRTDPVIGVAFDGMGWGGDGKLWGSEFMLCDLAGFERIGSLEPIAQPGGDMAEKRIQRMAYSHLRTAFGDRSDELAGRLMPEFAKDEMRGVSQIMDRGVNCPTTSGMGRLFDSISALLGICGYNTFHAQAPMELEAAAWRAQGEDGFYEVEYVKGTAIHTVIRSRHLIQRLVEDFLSGASTEICAARFHNSIARLVLNMCLEARENTGIRTVAISGGVMSNAYLVEKLLLEFSANDFELLFNKEVPPGDGGVSLGQAAVAAWRWLSDGGKHVFGYAGEDYANSG